MYVLGCLLMQPVQFVQITTVSIRLHEETAARLHE